MKKTIAILVALLFILSLVPVFADENPENTAIGISTRSSARERIKVSRDLIKESNQKLKEDIRNVKEELKENRQKLENKRKSFAEFKDQIKQCKGKDTDDCKTMKTEATLKAAEFLKITSATMLNTETQVLTTIQAAPEFEGKVDVVAKIQEDLNNLITLKTQIDALGDTSDREQVKTLAKSLRELWKNSKPNMKFGAGFVLTERLSGILVQSERLETKLKKTLERLKAKGHDTTKADAKVVEFNQDITDAKAELNLAHAKVTEARLATGATLRHEAVISAHEHLKAAQEKLKAAREILKEVVHEIKGITEGEKQLETETKEQNNEETTENTNAQVTTNTSATTDTNNGLVTLGINTSAGTAV